MAAKFIKVGIVEDDAAYRASLTVLVQGTPGYQCAGAWGTAEAALIEVPRAKPDVVLVDVRLPKSSGVELVGLLKPRVADTQFVMLTVVEDAEVLFEALAVGATGYLLKDTPPADLLEAVADAHRGGSPMSSVIARKVVGRFQRAAVPAAPPVAELTDREREVLELIARGYLYKEVGEKLGIHFDTVRTHIRRIYGKLQVHNRTQAAARLFNR